MQLVLYQVLAYLALPLMLFLAILKVSLEMLVKGMFGTV
jgi:hypothetical protein